MQTSRVDGKYLNEMRVLEPSPGRHVARVRATEHYHGTVLQIFFPLLRLDKIREVSERLVDVQVLQIFHADVPKIRSVRDRFRERDLAFQYYTTRKPINHTHILIYIQGIYTYSHILIYIHIYILMNHLY